MTHSVFVLIHSPLVGPFTWKLVAEALRQQGIEVVVPSLKRSPGSGQPFWLQHVSAIAQTLETVPAGQPVLLAGHSGAGPLLPAIRQAIPQPASGYIFVDAGWPVNGKSYLDLFPDKEEVERFRQSAQDGFLPTWGDDDLKPVIPDDEIRQAFVSELHPLPLQVYEEPLPVFSGWPDAPCGYLRFGQNPAYDQAFALAHRSGCPHIQLQGEHFHMLVDPLEVTQAVLNLALRMGVP